MMKQFFWKIVLCVTPVLLSLGVVWDAFANERFKLGVDLVGGTILVYEIDTRKTQTEGKEMQDPKVLAQNLADKLKNRIDPNDLYNVVIRPVGGEGRVEIILPTGGVKRAEEADKEWQGLLRKLEQKYDLPANKLDVPRGQAQTLTDRILALMQERLWEQPGKGLFGTPQSRQRLIDTALGDLALKKKDTSMAPVETPYTETDLRPLVDEISAQRLEWRSATVGGISSVSAMAVARGGTPAVAGKKAGEAGKNPYRALLTWLDPKSKLSELTLNELIKEVKESVDDYAREREIDAWFKQQAWKKLIDLILDKYPVVYTSWTEGLRADPKDSDERKQQIEKWKKEIEDERKKEFYDIPPDSISELVGRVEMKGDTIGQAFLFVMEGVTGEGVLEGYYAPPSSNMAGKFIDAADVLQFVKSKYGPSAQMVMADIKEESKASGYRTDLTVEEVQRIKDLVSRVGSLEFSILANAFDDKDAIKDATEMLSPQELEKYQELKAEVLEAQNRGLPPPGPRQPGTKEPKVYTIKLRNQDAYFTYSWVELGPQERQQLHLNNSAIQEEGPIRAQAWVQLNEEGGPPRQIKFTSGGEASTEKPNYLLQGALFYKRECKDRNLPEAERLKKKWEYFVLRRNPEINPATGLPGEKVDGSFLVNAANQPGSDGRPAVSFMFNNKGGQLFSVLTRKNIPTGEGSLQIKRHLAIILDGLVMSAPTINSEISTHGQISGTFTNKEVDNLVNILRAGALPASLKPQPVSESTMSATLGQDTIRLGVQAVVGSFIVILAFMIVYYRFAGLVASVALLCNLVLTVGFMVAVKATFTLPGLAGLVLMLGMAVDANILIYERLREERERGASLFTALRNGYDRALPTIIDTHLSSIFTAVVLYIVGNDQLKGFGVTLTVGLLISLFTSLYMTRAMFDLWAAMGWLKKLSMLRLFSRPDIDFMSIRYYLFAATGILTILGIALFIGRLPNDLNIDFVGGTAYSGQLEVGKAKNIEELRGLFAESRQKELLKAKARELDERGQVYSVWYGDGTDSDKSKYTVMLANKPSGDTPEARAKNVADRASTLPDLTVEQIFLSTKHEADPDKSRYFSIRTTEKEPDIVQAVLNRLLQDEKGEDLLQKVKMQSTIIKKGRDYRIQFVEAGGKGEAISASPSFVTTLFARELVQKFGVSSRSELPVTFELTGEGQMDEGRFKVAKLSIIPLKAKALSPEDIKHVEDALEETKNEFTKHPQPDRLETFDSQLAADTRLRAMYAILLSWAAILLYLWFRFGSWTFGLAAVVCLIHDLFFTLGVIAACHYVNTIWPGFLGIEDFKIDLPAVAALLTLVGYSVNDTIVVFDRIREVRGKNPDLTPQIINDSVNQTLSRTILSSLTTWLVVIVLYIFGGPGVHLFAFVMVVGVVVGTYSSIYVASPLLLLFGEGSKATARITDRPPTPESVGPDTRIQPATP
jgi:SecD/SecF fusion protein